MNSEPQFNVVDRHGRGWTIKRVPESEAHEADLEFWQNELSGEQRVLAVYDALESSLKAQGINEVPRFRRVHRRVRSS